MHRKQWAPKGIAWAKSKLLISFSSIFRKRLRILGIRRGLSKFVAVWKESTSTASTGSNFRLKGHFQSSGWGKVKSSHMISFGKLAGESKFSGLGFRFRVSLKLQCQSEMLDNEFSQLPSSFDRLSFLSNSLGLSYYFLF